MKKNINYLLLGASLLISPVYAFASDCDNSKLIFNNMSDLKYRVEIVTDENSVFGDNGGTIDGKTSATFDLEPGHSKTLIASSSSGSKGDAAGDIKIVDANDSNRKWLDDYTFNSAFGTGIACNIFTNPGEWTQNGVKVKVTPDNSQTENITYNILE